MSIRVLIIDNEQSLAETVSEALQRKGYDCTVAIGGVEGCSQLDHSPFDVVITDLVMEDRDGFEVLRHARQVQPLSQVIMMTGHGSIPSAVSAMSEGAFTYLQKPLDLQQLRIVVGKASENAMLRQENRQLHERLDEKFGFEGVIGSSVAMRGVIERLKRISPTSATVLIQGQTGTGKELIAQAIHQNSPRKAKPFVGLNCAALSDTILESELFGHVRGAFTDAIEDRIGKFEFANGGTLFLDEVGDMPMSTQIKLLRVLESSEITRVGANKPIKVNVRLISATNRDLETAVADGSFRSDLYHRIKVVTVRLPGLAQRREDIPILVDYFVRQFSEHHSKKIDGISAEVRKRLMVYDWPGNVRQLRNFVESMIVFDIDGILDVDDAPEELLAAFDFKLPPLPDGTIEHVRLPAINTDQILLPPSANVPLLTNSASEVDVADADTSSVPVIDTHFVDTFLGGLGAEAGGQQTLNSLVGLTLDEVEKRFIQQTLIHTNGNREEAARLLNIGQRTLYRKIKEYDLKE